MSFQEGTPDRHLPVLVSVVIPTRGRAGTLRSAVQSALNQTFSQLEVLVVIDGDDRETSAMLDEIRDIRLSSIPLFASVGAAEARNVGVRAARGEWIAFLDDDDEWLSHKLELQMSCAREARSEFPIVCSAYMARSPEGDILFGRKAPRHGEAVSEYMFCRTSLIYGENALATSVLFVRKQLMLSVPFDSVLKRHQDWDWGLRALNTRGAELYYIAEPLSIYMMPVGLARMSAHHDWRYSLQWCKDRRMFFTPKAFGFFIVTECMTRAREAGASLWELTSLWFTFLLEGKPTLRSFGLGLGYMFVSNGYGACCSTSAVSLSMLRSLRPDETGGLKR